MLFNSESPYPEVRAAVASVDDPLMPVNTFRMWFLGIIFALLTSGLNQIFSLRCMSISLDHHQPWLIFELSPFDLPFWYCCPVGFSPLR